MRVSAASVNPIDWKLRSGAIKVFMPKEFPEVLGRDLSGVVQAVGDGVTAFAPGGPGDRVFALANHTYAKLCMVKADELAKIPEGLDPHQGRSAAAGDANRRTAGAAWNGHQGR